MPRAQSTSLSITLMLLLAVWMSLPASAQSNAEAFPTNSELLNNIVQRMTEAQLQNRAHIRPYSVTRDYVVYGHDADNPKGHVLARIDFLPPNQKSYNIAESTGGMQEKVVRRILEHEVEVTKDPANTYLTPHNYDFEMVGEEQLGGRRCYLLKTHPKRSDKDLLKATVWVDANTYKIMRLEGEPNKAPSFWVKDVHIILDFGEVSGMWLQTASHAIAHVRFAGNYNLYSRDVRYQTAPVEVAAAATGKGEAGNKPTVMASANVSATPASSSTKNPVLVSTAHRGRALRRTTPFIASGIPR